MPNTNPSDLDREALKAAIEAYENAWEYFGKPNGQLEVGIRAYISALPRTSGVPEAEAVAWRFKPLSSANGWDYSDTEPRFSEVEYWTVEPLYAAPPPVAAPSGELDYLNSIARKLRTYISIYTGDKEARKMADWCERMASSPIASEPKDEGSGEGQEMTRDEQAEAVDTARWSHPIRPSTYEFVDALNAHGFAIVSTAPSGAKP